MEYYEYLRTQGFNCFPIPSQQKEADHRYDASRTIPNQDISNNYGYIPGEGQCIVDFDDKAFWSLLSHYAEKYMVIKTRKGFHLPVKGISGIIKKTTLYYPNKYDKQIIDVQGPDSYCVGPGSVVKINDIETKYENVGKNEIFDVKGTDFKTFIDMVCVKFDVEQKQANNSHNQMLRKQFEENTPPGPGNSNDYFFQAALVCNTEQIPIDEAINRIKSIYEIWEKTPAYSGRSWSNIEAKINDVYDNDLTIHHGGHKTTKHDTDKIVSDILNRYKLYSDKESWSIYEQNNGFLKHVTSSIKLRIVREFNTDIHTTNETMQKLTANAPDMPEMDTEIIVFNNGYYNYVTHQFFEQTPEKPGIMGFENYSFQKNPKYPKFDKFINDTFPDEDQRRYALLAAACAIVPEHQEKITMCFGPAGTGKSTYREILYQILDGYGVEMELKYLFEDKYATAEFENKTYVSVSEAPKDVKEFDKLKRITGESKIKIRKMRTLGATVPNYTKIIMDTNNLFKVPEDEAGPMFDRLHLLEFTKRFRYTDNDIKNLAYTIANEEGEHIISYLLQLDRASTPYPSVAETKNRWEEISFPEKKEFVRMFEYSKEADGMAPIEVKEYMEEKLSKDIDMKTIKQIAGGSGFQIAGGVYKGLRIKENQNRIDNF